MKYDSTYIVGGGKDKTGGKNKMNNEYITNINWLEHNSLDILCLIQELQEQDLIDEYGNINEIELTETYGELEADNILKAIPFNAIFKTVEVDKLYERAISCVQDIRLDLIRHRLHREDVVELLAIYEAILTQESIYEAILTKEEKEE